MAAITPVTLSAQLGRAQTIRAATAQANTGQTDWFWVPKGALQAEFVLTFTAVAGTTPLLTVCQLFGADPITKDDTHTFTPGVAGDLATTDIDPSGVPFVIRIDAGLLNIADELVLATADKVAVVNCVLPALMGIRLTFDRTTGNETYTYNLSATFRGAR